MAVRCAVFHGITSAPSPDFPSLSPAPESFFFKENEDARHGGYAKFLLHLMSYLFHCSLSHKKGKYNLTNKCDIDLYKYLGKRGGNPLHYFYCKLMELTEEEYLAVT